MPETKTEILDYILYYKGSLEKSDDTERITHCLNRLSKLKMSVEHLQQTGIGRVVNQLAKIPGENGEIAKKLVTKWKSLVAETEKSAKEPTPEPLMKLPIKLEPDYILEDLNFPELDERPMIKVKEERRSSLSQEKKPEKTNDSRTHHSSHHSSHKSSHHSSHKSSHHSSSSSRSKDKLHEKDKKKEKSSSKSSHSEKSSKSSKSTSPTSNHHHSHSKKSNHSKSSHSGESSSKRKCEETSLESKENDRNSSKKPKLELKVKSEPLPSTSKVKPKEKSTKKVVEAPEMDSSQGIGFAEAMMLFDAPSTSKKRDLQIRDKVTKVIVRPEPKSDSKKSLKELTAPPKLLLEKPKLEPLPDIVNDLPSDISIPEYRPNPLSSHVKDYINSSLSNQSFLRPTKHQTDAELLTESFSSKANRTRVFSGNRTQKSIPSLFDSCIRVLQEHIEYLTETGGVPFDILRPVLERAKPDQLATIEFYNSYLLDDSDVLWEPHCKRMFRTRQRQEMESWREMYERCTREDEEKLSRLTRNIKQHQEKADEGVQKTRLAFIDSLVKPPRNIIRKQEIYGTNRKLVASPAARTVGLKHIMPNMVAPGDARLRVAAGLRDDAQQVVGRGNAGRNNIKKAPMMAKILSKFKR